MATYNPDTPELLTELKPVNVIYGANGAGKTTLSRLIANPNISPDCGVSWRNGNPIPTLVYNSDFIADNYSDSKDLKGVFTLGKAEQAQLDKLEALKAGRKRCEQLRDSVSVQLNGVDGRGGKHADLRSLDARFVGHCWEQKTKYDNVFEVAFKGSRNSKDSFRARVLQEHVNNKSALVDLEDLEKRATVLYGQTPVALNVVPVLDLSVLTSLASNPILKKKIIGKSDVDVAGLIERLGNSDWVRQGIKYLEHTDEQCPFCQQGTPHDFEKNIVEYFDETFEADIKALNDFASQYAAKVGELIARAQGLLEGDYQHLDKEVLALEFKAFEALLQVNKDRLASKASAPSVEVELESFVELDEKIRKVIAVANSKVAEHNKLVADFATEQAKLTSDVWRYLIEVELKTTLSEYAADKVKLDGAISGMSRSLERSKQDILQADVDIAAIESELTSVRPTVIAINALLKDFGFRSFSLEVAQGDNSYKLIRSNGTDARKTLSEGEKTFVTFLYFYHLLRGSTTASGVTSERIVVIDDPVSSLDSDVLFIVGSMIKQLFRDVRTTGSTIRQIFVLTHNVHFHKEITFDPQRSADNAMAHESFWVVRKPDHFSTIERHDQNPIKTSYQLLWSELRKNPLPTLTLQNTLRRILENYFKILGGVDTSVLLNKFEGLEKVQCQSLISWVNDGSHFTQDDLYLAIGERTAASYMRIFYKIFKASNHMAHYKMMMGSDFVDLAPDEVEAEVADEANKVEAEAADQTYGAQQPAEPAAAQPVRAAAETPEDAEEVRPTPEPGYVVALPLAVATEVLDLLPEAQSVEVPKPRPAAILPAQPGLLPPDLEDDLDSMPF
ncbi:AAA family ATPase [Pseudomonas kermanshahensis]|uniref:AAA family ATPase n=1 Tax=Pseudomonas kermanshahensis TaxID=2745482 RepID=UPI0023DA5786|nr:AAA family ATPase [Pseudomonas kermanshahensis]WEL58292.1 AAA family ATPase [Pseudomonas kermanshahensis]